MVGVFPGESNTWNQRQEGAGKSLKIIVDMGSKRGKERSKNELSPDSGRCLCPKSCVYSSRTTKRLTRERQVGALSSPSSPTPTLG